MLEAIISFLPTEGNGAIGALDWTPEERKKLAIEVILILIKMWSLHIYIYIYIYIYIQKQYSYNLLIQTIICHHHCTNLSSHMNIVVPSAGPLKISCPTKMKRTFPTLQLQNRFLSCMCMLHLQVTLPPLMLLPNHLTPQMQITPLLFLVHQIQIIYRPRRLFHPAEKMKILRQII